MNDNASTDGTSQSLKELNDSRISFHINDYNLGCCINYLQALEGATGEYSLFIIDRDRININHLSTFIDILELHKPLFGYVELNSVDSSIQTYSPGEPAIIHGGGYASKHPSGFFFKTKLFKKELQQSYYSDELKNKFVFLIDMIAAALGAQYPATIISLPLITDANHRAEKNTPTNSYTKSNLYWSAKERLRAFNYYSEHLSMINCSNKDKSAVLQHLTQRTIVLTTIYLGVQFDDKDFCQHYGIERRKVYYFEMLFNLSKTIYYTLKNSRKFKITLSKKTLHKTTFHWFVTITKKQLVKPLIKGIFT